MHGLMPNPLTKLSESTEEDEVLRSRKRKLDMEAESDGEQLREQLRLHLEDKRILNGDAGKRLRRDFGRLLKSGEEGVPMADIDYEICWNRTAFPTAKHWSRQHNFGNSFCACWKSMLSAIRI